MEACKIKFEAIEVRSDSGVCEGLAETAKGETFIMDGRTPNGNGMCSNAFCALSNAAFIMMAAENKLTGDKGYIERVCPHGAVTFRISRINSAEKQ